ncbi:STAS/SEC14 domain-containing protein [Thiolapillus sp.]
MFQFIPVADNNIFAVRASGKLTDADYRQFLPQLEDLIQQHRPISLLLELEDFHGWEPKAVWDDFKFGMAHDKDFERIAIVGENSWQKWMATLGNAFTDARVRFFTREQLQEAWDWLRESQNNTSDFATQDETESEEPPPWKHILVAMDFSPLSRMALNRALQLCRSHGAQLSLIHAVEVSAMLMPDYDVLVTAPLEYLDFDQQRFDQAVAALNSLAKSLNWNKVQADVIWGAPKSAVLSYAEAQNADLIVVGSHGRHGFARLLGSTASAIANSARTDVLLVRQPYHLR